MKNLFANLQQVGNALMLPVSVLPVAGILLGVGAAKFSVLPATLSSIMEQAGGAVFGNMALLFAIGVALGLGGVNVLLGGVMPVTTADSPLTMVTQPPELQT